MDVIARVIKLRPDSADRVREWAETMNARRAEAVATLRDEGVEIESWFSFVSDGEDYLICYMRAESLERAQEVSSRSAHAIDAIQQRFKTDTWVQGAEAVGTLLLDLSTRE